MSLLNFFKALPKIYRTIIFLKFNQLYYQIKYRLATTHNLAYYQIASGSINWESIKFNLKLPQTTYATDQQEFDFLNLKKRFEPSIDWNYQAFGKLWNYNLQYFYFLQQDNLPDETKFSWLIDINNWLKDGRLKLEPYPVSIRLMNVIRYLSDKKKPDAQIIEDSYAQLSYLNNNIEYHLLGNHVLENAFALLMGGVFFKKESWIKRAKKILFKELNEQILNDGGHFELSPMYHQIVLFRLLELIDWYANCSVIDDNLLKLLKQKSEQMLSWLQQITFENGDIPHFNDSANGITYTSTELFNFADKLGFTDVKRLTLSGSGYRKIVKNRYECLIDVGDIGPSYQPGHGHADALSFILYVDNKPLFIEAGTSTYQIGEIRNRERATCSHNTVDINGNSQSEVWSGFRVGKRANVKITKDQDDALIAAHDGYKREYNAIHQREFDFKNYQVIIKDTITTSMDIFTNAYFHFHPDCQVVQQPDKSIIIDTAVILQINNAYSYELKKFKYSTGFNQYRTSVYLIVQFQDYLETHINFM
jgi:uncharacterized heparinase superfamily protein